MSRFRFGLIGLSLIVGGAFCIWRAFRTANYDLHLLGLIMFVQASIWEISGRVDDLERRP